MWRRRVRLQIIINCHEALISAGLGPKKLFLLIKINNTCKKMNILKMKLLRVDRVRRKARAFTKVFMLKVDHHKWTHENGTEPLYWSEESHFQLAQTFGREPVRDISGATCVRWWNDVSFCLFQVNRFDSIKILFLRKGRRNLVRNTFTELSGQIKRIFVFF